MTRTQRIFTLSSIIVIALINLQFNIQSSAYAQQNSVSWFPPVNLSKSGGVTNPNLIVDPEGVFHVIWEDEFAGFVYSSGDGLTWSEPQPVEFPFSPVETSFYNFSIDSREKIHALWITEEGDLYYSRSSMLYFTDRLGWEFSQVLARSTISFDISIDENSNIHLALLRGESRLDDIPAGIYYQRILDGETDWSNQIVLEQTPYLRTVAPGDANIDIATTLQNEEVTVYITWDNPPKKQVYLAQSDDTGVTWNIPISIGKPQDAFNTPNNINIEAAGNHAMIIWNLSDNSESCSQQFIWTSDYGSNWQNPELLFDKQYGCPEESHLFGTEDGFLLFAIMNDQGFFQFWNNEEWSLPQQQYDFNNLTDPETNLFLDLHSLQAKLVDGTLYMIGSDKLSTSDIWSTGSTIIETQSWFPHPTSWSKPKEIVQAFNEIGSTYLVADSIGQIHAFWNQDLADGSSKQTEIYYSVWNGSSWSTPGKILRSPSNNSYLHSTAISSDDVIFLVWDSGNSDGLTVSSANANSAYNPADWINSDPFPSSHWYATSPDICINREGQIVITYVLPLNENRGAYYIQSSDRGNSWEQANQIVDGVAEGWEMIDNPRISSCSKNMEVIWTTFTLPPDPIPLSLYAASSIDVGATWSTPKEIVKSNLIWSDVLQTADNNIHRIWEENERGVYFLWHQHSSDQGNRWNSPENILTTNDTIEAISTLTDSSERIHLFFATTNTSDTTTIHHWIWNGDNWVVNESVNLGKSIQILPGSLSNTITSEGLLGVIFGTRQLDQANQVTTYHINYSDRNIDIPELDLMVITPTLTLIPTQTPEIMTSTPALEASPTATPDFSNEPSVKPQTNAWSGFITGGAIGFFILVVIITVGLFIRFRNSR